MPSDTPNGDGYANNIDRRLDRMSDVITGMIDAMQITHKAVMEELAEYRSIQRNMLEIISESRGEIQDLLLLQREHRIDIMAPFMASKETRARLEAKDRPPTDPAAQ